MRDKNGVEIQVGDWVTWAESSYGYRVVGISPGALTVKSAGVLGKHTFEIISAPQRRKRKLTLSQGLAWLAGQMLLVYGNGDKDWRVRKISGDEGPLVGEGGKTLLKAIIAARKALGVK